MSSTDYDDGDAIRYRADFTDLAGTPTNPTTVTLYIERHDGTIVQKTFAAGDLTNPQVGRFEYIDSAVGSRNGRTQTWFRFVGAGAVKQVGQSSYMVSQIKAAP